jgi:molecular chaperone DnaK
LKDAGVNKDQITEVILVGGMTRMPLVQSKVKEVFEREPSHGVNPDEVVAIGAALQAAIISGDVDGVVLLDVTPLSLGIETLGGVFTRMINRNTTIPTKKTETYSTAQDNQPSVTIHVLQGERPMAKDNKTLGRFELVDIPPSPRGIPQIEVTFDIDVNGIVQVSAKDKGTGKEQTIKITASSGLSPEEIANMIKDAEEHAEEDVKRREMVDLRNRADNMTYSIEKLMSEHQDKLDDELRKELEEKIAEVKRLVPTEVKEDIEKALDELNKASHTLSSRIYAPPPGTENPAEGGPTFSAGDGPKAYDQNGNEVPIDIQFKDVGSEG